MTKFWLFGGGGRRCRAAVIALLAAQSGIYRPHYQSFSFNSSCWRENGWREIERKGERDWRREKERQRERMRERERERERGGGTERDN